MCDATPRGVASSTGKAVQSAISVLFHSPRVELRRPVFAANVDDYWTGGIDECIPTGGPCVVGGESLPSLGETWSMPWSVVQEDSNRVRFERNGVITPLRLSRTMEVRPGERMVRCHHTVTNVGCGPIEFLWGLHAGLPLAAGAWLGLPATEAEIETSFPGDRLGGPGDRHSWSESRLLDLGPQPAGTWDLHYASGLTAGWLAVRSGPEATGFGMTFPHEVFRSVWIWVVDGGWRGTRCLAVEPWTGHPFALDRAIARGAATRLEPGASLSVDINLIVFPTAGEICGFEEDGTPIQIGDTA